MLKPMCLSLPQGINSWASQLRTRQTRDSSPYLGTHQNQFHVSQPRVAWSRSRMEPEQKLIVKNPKKIQKGE